MNDFNKKTRVALYVRVSTDEQASKGVSIEHQVESLTDFAKNKDYQLNESKHVYIDKGYSGASKHRPGLERLMFDAQNGEFDLVLVKKVDRFFRKNLYLLQYVEELCQSGVGFKAVDQGFNVEDTSGKMMLSMLGVIGEMERDLIRDRTISGKIQKAKMGYYVGGGYAKLGYTIEKDGRGNKLIVDEEEAELVRRIFHMYANEDKTFYDICDILNREGVRTKYDKATIGRESYRPNRNNFWYTANISSLIREEMYIGNYYYGKRGLKYDRAKQKELSYWKPRSEWVVMNCPRIIDDALFYKAQERLKKNKVTKNNKNPSIFAGLIKCTVCGRSYAAYKTCKNTISYRCIGNALNRVPSQHRCFNRQVSEKYLIPNIWNQIDRIFRNPKKMLEEYYSSKNQNTILDGYKHEYDVILKKSEKYMTGIKSIYRDIYLSESEVEKEMKQEAMRTMQSELDTINKRKDEIAEQIARLQKIDESKENVVKFTETYKEIFSNLTEAQKIRLIQDFTEKVLIHENGRVVVHLKFGDYENDFTHLEYEIRKEQEKTHSH